METIRDVSIRHTPSCGAVGDVAVRHVASLSGLRCASLRLSSHCVLRNVASRHVVTSRYIVLYIASHRSVWSVELRRDFLLHGGRFELRSEIVVESGTNYLPHIR